MRSGKKRKRRSPSVEAKKRQVARVLEAGRKTRWKKGGPSPNPAGRPPGWRSITRQLRDDMGKPIEAAIPIGLLPPMLRQVFSGRTVAQVIALRAELAAIGGDARAREFVTDRTDGPIKQTVGIDGEGGAIISIEALRALLKQARDRRAARERDEPEADAAADD